MTIWQVLKTFSLLTVKAKNTVHLKIEQFWRLLVMEILLMLSYASYHKLGSEPSWSRIWNLCHNDFIMSNKLWHYKKNATLNCFVPIVKAKKKDLRNPERKDYCGVIEMVTFIELPFLTLKNGWIFIITREWNKAGWALQTWIKPVIPVTPLY